MPEVELPKDHWVSRGYQQNFASADNRVAVFSVRAGRVVDAGRPIKSNFREQGFTTFLEAGVPNDLLERAFASVESRVLNEIRTISAARRGPQQKADVANLFSVHLVRSPAFRSFHRHFGERFRAALAEVACHPDDAQALRQTYSRLDRLPPSILTGR